MRQSSEKPELTHERVANVLRAEIKEHRAPGDRLEDQHTLCHRFGVSYMTMHKAMRVLAHEGMIHRVPRRGTVVAGGESVETRTVTLLAIRGWPVNATLRRILRDFQAAHRLGVRLQEVDEEELVSCVRELQRRGAAPDLLITNTWCQRELIAARALQDVEPFCEPSLLKQCDATALRWASRKTRLQGMPFCLSPVVMFCNLSLFREAGVPAPAKDWTWGDFLDVARRLTLRNPKLGTVEHYGYAASEDRNRWPILVVQNHGSVIKDDGSACTLNQPASVEAIQFYRDLIHRHKVSPGPRPHNLLDHLFHSGRIGMFAAGFFALRTFSDANAFDWNVTLLPAGKNRTTYLSAVNLALPKGSKHGEAFRKLSSFLLSDESQIRLGLASDGLPLRRSLWRLKAWRPPVRADLNWDAFLDAVSDGHPLVVSPRSEALHSIQERLHLVWSNLQPVQEACDEICSQVNPMLRGPR